jgi:vacuolar protein sorting-associated protein 45
LIEISKDYFENMINMCTDRKALIMDQDTLGYVSLNYSRSKLLEKNVYFFDTIDKKGNEKLKHLSAIFFVRNTPENFLKIKEELANPLFSNYYLLFANPIEDQKLREFADCDKYNHVLKVVEMFADFYAINRDLFSFNIPTSMDLLLHESNMTNATQAKQNRILQGLFSLILSCRKHPFVRYAKHSNRAAKLADSLVAYMSTE